MNKIKLTKPTINRLMKLYYELDTVPNREYDQNDCDACVIGHAIQRNVIRGITFDVDEDTQLEEFNNAVRWVGLPFLEEDLSTSVITSYVYTIFPHQTNYEFGLLGNYLFGNEYTVPVAASVLGLTFAEYKTPKHAQKRIEIVLGMAGYELVWEEV